MSRMAKIVKGAAYRVPMRAPINPVLHTSTKTSGARRSSQADFTIVTLRAAIVEREKPRHQSDTNVTKVVDSRDGRCKISFAHTNQVRIYEQDTSGLDEQQCRPSL